MDPFGRYFLEIVGKQVLKESTVPALANHYECPSGEKFTFGTSSFEIQCHSECIDQLDYNNYCIIPYNGCISYDSSNKCLACNSQFFEEDFNGAKYCISQNIYSSTEV